MKCAGAGPGGYQYLAASAASEAGIVGASLEREFLNSVDAGNVEQRGIRTAVVDVRSVHRPVIGRGARAVDGDRRVAVNPAKARLIAEQVHNARLQRNQLLKVAIHQLQLTQLRSRDSSGLGAAFRVDGHRVIHYRHGLALLPGLQLRVHRTLLRHIQDNVVIRKGLEVVVRDSNGISAGRKIAGSEIAVIIYLHYARLSIYSVEPDGDGGMRNHCPCGVGDRTSEGSR